MNDTVLCQFCGQMVPAGRECQTPEDADECPVAEKEG